MLPHQSLHVHTRKCVRMCGMCTHVYVLSAEQMLRECLPWQAEGHHLRESMEVGKYKGVFEEQGRNVSRVWQKQVRL